MSILCLLFLASCSTNAGQVSKNIRFNTQNDKALVIFGASIFSRAANPSFHFRQFNKETGLSTDEDTFVARSYSLREQLADRATQGRNVPRGHRYYVFKLDPGHWFLQDITAIHAYGNQRSTQVIAFTKGAAAFEAKAGQIAYLGEFWAKDDGEFESIAYGPPPIDIKWVDANLDAANAYLTKYPNISGEAVYVKPDVFRYSCADDVAKVSLCPGDRQQLDLSRSFARPHNLERQ